ncbi:MAG: hypothetical protein AB7F21_05495 [Desulfuromonadales bacterium]
MGKQIKIRDWLKFKEDQSDTEGSSSLLQDLRQDELIKFLAACEGLADGELYRQIVTRNLIRVLRAAEKIALEPPWTSIRPQIKELRGGLSSSDCGERMLADCEEIHFDVNGQIDLLKRRFPLWVTFAQQCDSLDQFPSLVQLLAQIICAVLALQVKPEMNMIKRACSTARSMAQEPTGERLALLPAQSLLPSIYCRELHRLPRLRGISDLENLLEDAADLINDEDFGDDLADADVEIDEDELDRTAKDIPLAEDWDGEAFEVASLPIPSGLLASKHACGRRKSHSRGGAARAMAKANQRYRRSWSELSQGDLHLLLKSFQMEKNDHSESLVLALVGLMFWFGMTEKRLAELRIGGLNRLETHPDEPLYYPRDMVINLPSLRPVLKEDPPEDEQSFERVTRIDLLVPALLRHHLEAVCRNRVLKPGERLFHLGEDQIRQHCQSWLSKLKQRTKSRVRPGPRMTLRRIQKFLPHHSSRYLSADASVTNLMLGLDDYLGTTKVHYLATDAGRLWNHYNDVVMDVIKEAEIEIRKGDKYGVSHQIGRNPEKAVGQSLKADSPLFEKRHRGV